jgi:phosphoglycerate dehydrogenase-like enzyme
MVMVDQTPPKPLRGVKRSHAGLDERTLGVLGGGQLARMMAEAAHRLGLAVSPWIPRGSCHLRVR